MARFRSLFGRTFSPKRSFVLKETKRNVRVALAFVLKEIKRNVRVALTFVLKERLSDEPQITWLWCVAYNVYVNAKGLPTPTVAAASKWVTLNFNCDIHTKRQQHPIQNLDAGAAAWCGQALT